jgi:hypothetical protein
MGGLMMENGFIVADVGGGGITAALGEMGVTKRE